MKVDNEQVRKAFFDSLPDANEQDWLMLGGPVAGIISVGDGEKLEDHLIVDGCLQEADAKAFVAKLRERKLL